MTVLHALMSIGCAIWFARTSSPVAAFFGGGNLTAAIFCYRRDYACVDHRRRGGEG